MVALSHTYLLVGLPGTGKTSFLAALWYMVNQPTIQCSFRLDKLQGDISYLNMIRDSWLAYQPVPRTGLDSESVVAMSLKRQDTERTIELCLPDLSGESFRLQWSSRQFTDKYDALLRNASGVLLFVHPENVVKPYRVDTVNSIVGAIGEPNGDVVPTMPWDIEKAPTQVQLVELLQFMVGRDYLSYPFRLAIIVSAWDLLAGKRHSPNKWITEEMPLLHQFLSSNQEVFDLSVYGLSAQGGPYSTESEGFLALQRKPPARRISIIGNNINNQHDITEPLQWLMR